MAYDELVGYVRDSTPALSVTAFPDGSVDTYYRALDGDERIETREEFCSVLAADRDSLRLRRRQQVTGGQSVNMAEQVHALADEVTLAGHLDDPVFADLPFETVSLGEPATVSILLFNDGDLMLAEESQDIREWGVEDLRSAARDLRSREYGKGDTGEESGTEPKDPLSVLLDVDLVCSANWGAFHGMTEVFETVADARTDDGGSDTVADAHPDDGGSGAVADAHPDDGGSGAVADLHAADDRGVFVFDPGSLGGLSAEHVRALLDGIGVLESAYRTVLAANDVEIDALADAAGVSNGDRETQVEGIRDTAGISGVVAHMENRAVAATDEGTLVVPNLDTSRVATVTGAGDRFTGGMGHGLAAGWGWGPALALGNTCASYHVVHGETIPREGVADYVQRHEATL